MYKYLLCALLMVSACGPAPNNATPDNNLVSTPNQVENNTSSNTSVTTDTSTPVAPDTNVNTDTTVNTGSSNTDSGDNTDTAPVSPTTPTLEGVNQINVRIGNRFFSAIGQTSQLQVDLLDENGQRINSNAELSYSSSRPQDFSVDGNGQVTARVSEGFSTIIVSLNSLSATQLVSVSSPSSGGSGSTAPPEPTEENVNGQIEFEF